MGEGLPERGMNPAAIPLADLSRMLTAAGGRPVTPEQIQADIEAGAPVNANGTINLVHYGAWLVREIAVYGN